MPLPRRTLLRRVLALVAVVLGATATVPAVGCALSAPTWRGPAGPHFDGERFVTPKAPSRPGRFGELGGLSDFLSWQRTRQPGPWRAYRDEPPGPRPPAAVARGALRVTFINHATTLLQLDGVNVLTDPIYSARASPVSFAGPHRVRPPGVRFEDLPRIDAVVLSHNHYDHLDVATLKRIAATWPKVRFFAGLGNRAFLEAQGLADVVELDWWDARELGGVTVRSVPNQHFSNRGLFDGDGTLWTAWVLEGAGGRAYFGGDTGYGPHFAEVSQRLGPMRLAVLPIGAYRPEWFMGVIHMSPAEAVQAARDLRASLAVPMHYGTFPLADDGEDEPLEALRAALAETPAPFAVLDFGQGRDVEEVAP
jgi:L-ascorbate metabolism protein UlaG (beta-lactamase superfamily)